MNKILLCGNGVNIEFNKDFCFKNFIDILTNKKKLLGLTNEILTNSEYKEFEPFKEEFLEIFNKCKSSIINLDQESKLNGIEVAVSAFKRSVKTLILQSSLNIKEESLKKFEHFFDLLFFYFLAELEKKSKINLLKNSKWNVDFKDCLEKYQYIYTLNYDSLLTTIYNENYIWYVHGKLKSENSKLNYKECVFESYLNPKWVILQKTKLPIFLGKGDLKGEFNLDILGLNSKNDEEIFLFFIFSQVCNTITYYFYDEKTDLKNIRDLIESIKNRNIDKQTINLTNKKDTVILDFNSTNYHKKIEIIKDQLKLNYNFEFFERNSYGTPWKVVHKLEVKLIESKDFWYEVNKKEINIKGDFTDNKEDLDLSLSKSLI